MNKTDKAEMEKIAGSWRLVNTLVEFQDTGEKLALQWNGRFIIRGDGKFVLIMTQAGRTAPVTQAEQAAAFNTVSAVAGKYVIEGDQAIGTYEFATHPGLVGDFRTGIKFVGEHLQITPMWLPSAIYTNRITRRITEWERE